MTSSFKKLPGSGVELSVTIPLPEFKGYLDREFAAARAELHIKGFRPGMVPEDLARQTIGEKHLFDGGAKRAIKETLASIGDENNWTLIDSPKVEIKDDASAFSYIATLTLFPDVDVHDWQKTAAPHRAALAKKKAALAATPKETEETILWIRKSRATLSPKEGPAAAGDAVEIDMTNSLDPKPHHDRFVMGEGRFMPGFEEKIIGHAAGERLEFSLMGPADYWKEDLRGKKIDFVVTIAGVSARILPEPDDAFAKTLGKFTTFAELEQNVREGIITEKARHEDEATAAAILEDIVSKAKIDIPAIMTERITAQDPKLTDDTAKQRIAFHLVIHTIAENAGLQPTDEEVAREIAHYNAGSNASLQAGANTSPQAGAKSAEPTRPEPIERIDANRLHDYIYERIQQEKTYAELLGTDRN